ncbi:MAG: hypothetical protein M1486_00095 [Gammaproteobacteria bacterium]|nr:hypothetical protein [Gammaproteobacteria bacterium]
MIRLVTNELANQLIIPAKPWLYNFMFKWLGKNIKLFDDFKKMIIQPIQQNLDYPHEHPSHAFQSALICLRFIETKFALAPEPSTSFIPSERI